MYRLEEKHNNYVTNGSYIIGFELNVSFFTKNAQISGYPCIPHVPYATLDYQQLQKFGLKFAQKNDFYVYIFHAAYTYRKHVKM